MQSLYYRNPYYLKNQNWCLVPKYREEKVKENNQDYFDLGEPAPNFTLEGIIDGEPTNVSLDDYKGKWVLLFFYGSDFTFV
jgi:hypothetical protein